MRLSIFRRNGSGSSTAGDRPLRIALAGYGVVGQALAALLAEDSRFRIVAILVRDPVRGRSVPPPAPLTADREAFAGVPADVLIDALSCPRTAEDLIGDALAGGVHVVSAGKQAVASGLGALSAKAAQGAQLRYSAAVGGEAPVLETVAAARARGGVREVSGILNGTVNYILDRLARGTGFDQALDEARRAGFAEEDCTADLSGADAAAKLRLIAAEAFGIEPASLAVATEPLDASALVRIAAAGERWVQHASVARTGSEIAASVRLRPKARIPDLPLVEDEWNCAAVVSDDGTVLRCVGRGAGGEPTARAILADLGRLFPKTGGGLPIARAASC